MDIFSHALAGACTGQAFGRPVLGALLGALPDAVLWGPRRALPTPYYNITHSFLFLALCTAIGSLYDCGMLAYFCVFSHLLLDAPTHNEQWAPPLFWPLPGRCSLTGEEWEFFNDTWFYGLGLTLAWSIGWLLASFE